MIQAALIKAGLGINIFFLHSLDKKPVLVFDVIEEFRTFIVDRAIVFALNKSDDIKVDVDGRLTKEAKKRIIEEVNERMASLHIYKKEKWKILLNFKLMLWQIQSMKIKNINRLLRGFDEVCSLF